MFRFLFYNVLKLPNGELFITFGNEIAFYNNKEIEKIDIGKNKFRVLRSGCAYDNNGSIIFGEYHEKPDIMETLGSMRSVDSETEISNY